MIMLGRFFIEGCLYMFLRGYDLVRFCEIVCSVELILERVLNVVFEGWVSGWGESLKILGLRSWGCCGNVNDMMLEVFKMLFLKICCYEGFWLSGFKNGFVFVLCFVVLVSMFGDEFLFENNLIGEGVEVGGFGVGNCCIGVCLEVEDVVVVVLLGWLIFCWDLVL